MVPSTVPDGSQLPVNLALLDSVKTACTCTTYPYTYTQIKIILTFLMRGERHREVTRGFLNPKEEAISKPELGWGGQIK